MQLLQHKEDAKPLVAYKISLESGHKHAGPYVELVFTDAEKLTA